MAEKMEKLDQLLEEEANAVISSLETLRALPQYDEDDNEELLTKMRREIKINLLRFALRSNRLLKS